MLIKVLSVRWAVIDITLRKHVIEQYEVGGLTSSADSATVINKKSNKNKDYRFCSLDCSRGFVCMAMVVESCLISRYACSSECKSKHLQLPGTLLCL